MRPENRWSQVVSSITHHTLWMVLCLLLIACEPQPTPFPVDIPPPSTDIPTTSSQIRYAFAANTAGLVADFDLIVTSAQVEQLTEPVNPDELGSRYDIVAAYSDFPGGMRSPVTPHIALLANPTLIPLNNPTVINIMQRSIDTQAIIVQLAVPGAQADPVETAPASTLRAELANAGWPDGFALTIAYAYTPGAAQFAEQLRTIGIDSQLLMMSDDEIAAGLSSGQIHLALVAWTAPGQRETWVTRLGSANVIDLYTIPISYLALPELTITFTQSGWPLATR